MIRLINIEKYRRLQNIVLNFDSNLNLISGTNGTCKTSILHIISNTFQAPKNPSNVLRVIKDINQSLNPKIESLTKGDAEYNDPAIGHKGTLLTVTFTDGNETAFRKHNSKLNSRYAIKPYYPKGQKEHLKEVPVIYLGLTRLFSFGEFGSDTTKLRKDLPNEYKKEIFDVYNDFTNHRIANDYPEAMGDFKKRRNFKTDKDGIDSNTISAGEDNLLILLTTLVSLKYYYEEMSKDNGLLTQNKSILLIDEIESTLHPAFQLKLLYLLKEYSKKYNIQVFFTTHSFTMIQYAFKEKINVIYLQDSSHNVKVMHKPDYTKLEMDLKQKTRQDILSPKKIPVFSEDPEARIFINEIFDFFSEIDSKEFSRVRSCFHLIDASIGSDNLKAIFNDNYISEGVLKSICILDGDQTNDDKRTKANDKTNKEEKETSNRYLILPGLHRDSLDRLSPEALVFKHLATLVEDDDEFWRKEVVQYNGYTIPWAKENIIKRINEIDETIRKNTDGKSTKGKRRELNKRLFTEHKEFFKLIFRHWIRLDENRKHLNRFYKGLNIHFHKNCEFYRIDRSQWFSTELPSELDR